MKSIWVKNIFLGKAKNQAGDGNVDDNEMLYWGLQDCFYKKKSLIWVMLFELLRNKKLLKTKCKNKIRVRTAPGGLLTWKRKQQMLEIMARTIPTLHKPAKFFKNLILPYELINFKQQVKFSVFYYSEMKWLWFRSFFFIWTIFFWRSEKSVWNDWN